MDGEILRWRGWLQLLLGLTLTALFFYMMAPFLLPIVLGAVVAIICYPLMGWLCRFLPRLLAALLVTFLVVSGILMPLIALLYSGALRLISIFSQTSLFQAGNVDNLINHPVVIKLLNTVSRFIPADREWLQEQAMALGQSMVEHLTRLLGNFIAGMPGILVAFAVLILSAYFFLVDGNRFLRFLAGISPLGEERSQQLYGAFEQSCRGVVLGLFASSAVQAVLMATFYKITGLPSPAFAAAITFIMGMVPVVGSAPIWIGSVIYLFFMGSVGMSVVMLIGGILISTSDNVVRPLVMKGRAEMHPLLALVSVFGAVNLFGATGIFIGPVIAAVFVSFLRILALEIKRESPGIVSA